MSAVPPGSKPPPGQDPTQNPPPGDGDGTPTTPPGVQPTNQPPTSPGSPTDQPPPPPTTQAPPPPPPPTTSNPPEPEPSPQPPTTNSPPPPPPQPSTFVTQTRETTTIYNTPEPQPEPSPNPEPTPRPIESPSPTGTSTVIVTSSTTLQPSTTSSPTQTPTVLSSSGDNGGDSGLGQKGKVAVGVVVPIAAIAILAVLALFWWRKRKARRESEEQRRKEVEDYSYNPNADPTLPPVGIVGGDGYDMREDGSAGYRGWGSTVAGSVGRKASTTLTGAGAFSDSRAGASEYNGDVGMDAASSHDGEILGAMGPSAANNRGDVRRGPSNASSYSATGRSEGSDGGMFPGGVAYYDQYGQPMEGGGNGGGGAIIRDNPALRNTQIESSTHFPQQSAGIAQNF